MAAPKRSLDSDRVIRRAMTVTSDIERACEVVKRFYFYDGGARGEIAGAGCRAPCALHPSTPALPPVGLAIRRFHLRVEWREQEHSWQRTLQESDHRWLPTENECPQRSEHS